MSFELVARKGRAISLEEWRASARALGLEVTFAPGFNLAVAGFVTAHVRVIDEKLFPRAKWLLGERPAGFEFAVESHAGDAIDQRVYFRTSADRSPSSFVAQVVLAAAYALAAGGELHDPQDWGDAWPGDKGNGWAHTRSGEAGIRDALAHQLKDVSPGRPATGEPRWIGKLAQGPWKISDEQSTIAFGFKNQGGAFTGLRVSCDSTLLTDGTLKPERAEIFDEETGLALAIAEWEAREGFIFPDLQGVAGVVEPSPDQELTYVCKIHVTIARSGSGLFRAKVTAISPARSESMAIGRLAHVE